MKILVADDEPGFRDLFRFVLEPLGYEVVAVDDGAQAVAAMHDGVWDLVFLDSQMPHVDGLEALRCIHALEPEQPIVMMSGRADAASSHALESLEQGACAYLVKPFELEDLIAYVEQLARGAR